jgi:hypothetical protein
MKTIHLKMILALASSSGSSSWGWPIAASIGGVIVFIGLLLEKIAEWKNDRYSPPFFKPNRCLGECGWWLLMLGILAEIVVGFALAAKDEIEQGKTADQIAQTSTNLAKIDPLNLPIVLATADVEFFILGTNSLQGLQPPKNEVESDFQKMFVRLMFKDPDMGDFPVFLECDQISKMSLLSGNISGFLIRLNFKSNSLGSQWRTDKQSKKWGNFSAKKFDEFKEAEVSISGLLDKAEIRAGTCSVTLNSTIERNFSIDSQSSKDKIVLRPMKRNSDDVIKKQ